MRYWIVASEAPPKAGGIGTYVQEMSAALSARGHEVLVVLANWGLKAPIAFRDEPFPLVAFNPAAWLGGARLGLWAAAALGASNVVSFLARTRGAPDVIEVQEYGGLGYFILQRQLVLEPGFPRVPVAVRVHGPGFMFREFGDETRYALPSYWSDEMERFTLEAAHVVLSPSDAMDRHLVSQGIAARPVRARNPARLPLAVGEARYDADPVAFGRVSPLKGTLQLLDAFERLVRAGRIDNLTLIGNDAQTYAIRGKPMREYLEGRHAGLVADGRVSFRGALPREEAIEALTSARAVLLPSHFESFGYAALEAMAARRVVVVGGGAPADYVVDGVTGFVCDPASPASLDRALVRALDLDADERAAMGERAAAAAREICDPERAVDELLDALARLGAGGGEAVGGVGGVGGGGASPGIDGIGAGGVGVQGGEGAVGTRTFPSIRPRPRREVTADADEASGLLSVVIPCYNLGEFVEETLASVVASTYRPLEVIVIDDGSTDEATRAVVDGLSVPGGEDLSFRVVRTANQGLARTRNAGADLARGEFLIFVDADDAVRPTYFARAIDVLRAYDNVGFVGCWLEVTGAAKEWVTWNTEFPYMLFQNPINSACVVHRRRVFRSFGLNNPALITGKEDYDSILRIADAGWHGVAIPERLFWYRVRDDSMHMAFNIENSALMSERIVAATPAPFIEYAAALFGLQSANGPGWMWDNPSIKLYPAVVRKRLPPGSFEDAADTDADDGAAGDAVADDADGVGRP